MNRGAIIEMQPYLARLRELPFVQGARVRRKADGPGDREYEAVLELRVAGKAHRFLVELKRTVRLNYPLIEHLLGAAGRGRARRWILFTPFVTPPMAAHLRKRGVNYADLNGNCHLVIDRDHIAMVEGRRPARRLEDDRTVGQVAQKVFFALLARERLLQRPVREIADSAGVGKTQAAVVLRRLKEDGIVGQSGGMAKILRPAALLERWVAGYADILRPRLLIGHYRAEEHDPAELEDRIEKTLRGDWLEPAIRQADRHAPGGVGFRWAWGGAAAAYRLTGHFRSEGTILHLSHARPDMVKRLRVLPARSGPLTLLRVPGPVAFDGPKPNTAHPLLVYAELLAAIEDRSREAALEIRESFLKHLG